MQKRANPARTDKRKRRPARLIIGLTLAGSAAGGVTVGTERNCYGEVAAQVVTSSAWHGPKGSAARISASVGRVGCTDRTQRRCHRSS